MKMNLLLLSAILLLAGNSCQEKFDIEKEKEAVIAVIQDEKDGYTNMDLEQWSRNVLHDPSYTWMASSSEQYIFNKGYQKQEEWNKDMWSNWDPDESRDRIEFEVDEIRITPHAAWALINVSGRVEALFLEKIENAWVISLQAIQVTSSYKGDEADEADEADEGDGADEEPAEEVAESDAE